MLKKDKEKILDEVWTEDRILGFLDLIPLDGVDDDFHALSSSYKSMRLEDFDIFLGFFQEKNRNFNAKNPDGKTLLDIISTHRKGTPYTEALKQHGAI